MIDRHALRHGDTVWIVHPQLHRLQRAIFLFDDGGGWKPIQVSFENMDYTDYWTLPERCWDRPAHYHLEMITFTLASAPARMSEAHIAHLAYRRRQLEQLLGERRPFRHVLRRRPRARKFRTLQTDRRQR